MQQFSTEPSRLCGSGLELKARIEVLFKILKVMMICSVSWRPVLKCELYKLFFFCSLHVFGHLPVAQFFIEIHI